MECGYITNIFQTLVTFRPKRNTHRWNRGEVRDGKMGPARWAGPPARLKRYGPGHEFQPASPCQPGPSSPLARRASPRPVRQKQVEDRTLRTHITIHFSAFLNFFLFLCQCHPFLLRAPPTPPPNHNATLLLTSAPHTQRQSVASPPPPALAADCLHHPGRLRSPSLPASVLSKP